MTWRIKEIKNYFYQLRTKLTKAQTGNTKARCQGGNKAMKTKLTNILRGKERKGSKKKKKIDIYIKDYLQGEKNRKGNTRINVEKI